VTQDPSGSVILFLARAPTAARRRVFLRLDMAAPRPVVCGKNVFFKSPTTLRGKRTPINLSAGRAGWRDRCGGSGEIIIADTYLATAGASEVLRRMVLICGYLIMSGRWSG
jgi:hypothetical protein